MSILKSELKQILIHEIGGRMEDALEATKLSVSVNEGANMAFLEAAKAVEGLCKNVDQDVDAGTYGLETAGVVKKYLVRANAALSNLAARAGNLRIASTGKVSGVEHVVALLKNMAEQEKAKTDKLKAEEAVASLLGDAEGPRSKFISIKEQRLAEAATETAPMLEQAPELTPVPAVEPVPSVVVSGIESVTVEPEAPKKRERRGADSR